MSSIVPASPIWPLLTPSSLCFDAPLDLQLEIQHATFSIVAQLSTFFVVLIVVL